jgi:hypothetical protein
MDYMWPGHPEIWFLTDGDTIAHQTTIQFPGANWIEILHGGLTKLRSRYPEMEYVYLILEDLYPVWECQAETLSMIHRAALDGSFDVVLLFAHRCRPPVGPAISAGGVTFYELSPGYQYYNSLQPALWKLDYLLAACEHALHKGIETAWEFEWLNLGRTHYVAEYHWPCIFNGLFTQGRVNLGAVRRLKAKPFAKFRRQLVTEYILDLPRYGFQVAITKSRHVWNRFVNATQSIAF